MVEPNRASSAALGANRFTGFKVPGTGSEPILSVCQGTNRADFDDVSAELRRELGFAKGDGLHVGSAESETELGVTRNFFGKPNATGALDASFKVERDVIAEWVSLWRVPFHFDEATGAWAVEKGVVLERAFAASVTDWAVERVVDQQKFEDALSILFNRVGFGVYHEALAHWHGASRLRLGEHSDCPVRLLGTREDEAHSAHADWLHARVVAEDGDFEADSFYRFDNEFTFRHRQFNPVDDNVDGFDFGYGGHGFFWVVRIPSNLDWSLPISGFNYQVSEFRFWVLVCVQCLSLNSTSENYSQDTLASQSVNTILSLLRP